MLTIIQIVFVCKYVSKNACKLMCKVMLPAKSVSFKTDVMVFTLTLNMFFLSSEIVDCIVLTFENRVPFMCEGLNDVAPCVTIDAQLQ